MCWNSSVWLGAQRKIDLTFKHMNPAASARRNFDTELRALIDKGAIGRQHFEATSIGSRNFRRQLAAMQPDAFRGIDRHGRGTLKNNARADIKRHLCNTGCELHRLANLEPLSQTWRIA